MKQWARQSLAWVGCGIPGLVLVSIAQAGALDPNSSGTAMGAAWAADAATGPLLPAAALVLAWAPLLLLALLGGALLVLIWRQPRAADTGRQRLQRAGSETGLDGAALISAAKR